jgi:hypothetical protein
MADQIEIRNLRTEGEHPTGWVRFFVPGREKRDCQLSLPAKEWRELGRPAYVVITVRSETFEESTL